MVSTKEFKVAFLTQLTSFVNNINELPVNNICEVAIHCI